jgi:hypothetical protein
MKKLLLVALACYGLSASAQVRESNNFIYYYSDSLVYAKDIRLRPDYLNSMVLRADSRRIPINQVKFFNNEDGFFANTRKLNLDGHIAFSERIIEGKINLYQEHAFNPQYNEDHHQYSVNNTSPIYFQLHYNKGFGDLKRVDYDNLKYDMADNSKSMELLENYRRNMRTSNILYVSAGVSLLGALVTFLSSRGPGSNSTPILALFGIGAAGSVGGLTYKAIGFKRLEEAVDNYNR